MITPSWFSEYFCSTACKFVVNLTADGKCFFAFVERVTDALLLCEARLGDTTLRLELRCKVWWHFFNLTCRKLLGFSPPKSLALFCFSAPQYAVSLQELRHRGVRASVRNGSNGRDKGTVTPIAT
eukprot:g29667.t1